MNYLSVCSGIEAATVAWHDMGWKPVGFSEIERFPSQLLAHHYPTVTNFGDMTKFKEWNINESVNLLVGGTPCQSFSVAGLRQGLQDPRGNLMLTYLAMADHYKPKWLLWENVPGVLSSNGGNDFSALLQGMAQCGYGVAYRILDAQHFGVPQRRRRVFVVGCLGDWRSAAKVLFESESLLRDITPRREKRESSTSYTKTSFGGYSEGTGTLRASGGDLGGGSETLYIPKIANCLQTTCHEWSRADGFNMITQVYETHPADSRVKEMGDVCQTVTSRWGTGGGNVPLAQSFNVNARPDEMKFENELSGTLTSSQRSGFIKEMSVRRLTPIECERLQGFPDNYTNTPTSSDSTRYKALGNSMAVPVMRWIGHRINEVNND
jgi:DNA (cytosine-5)-methyltransferase 1